MNITWEIVTDSERFLKIVSGWSGKIACDTETHGQRWDENRHLLGVSLSPEFHTNGVHGIYIPCWYQVEGIFTEHAPNEAFLNWLVNQELVGHNFTYDKWWLKDYCVSTTWVADTRLMWHLSAAPAGPFNYGLKAAQTDILKWPDRGDVELEAHIRARGGKIKDGDHYLADVDVLAKYACLDTYATICLYSKLKPFFDDFNYWYQLRDMMAYNELLDLNTTQGVEVDREGLLAAHSRLLKVKDAALKRFMKLVGGEVAELEMNWADQKMSTYKRESTKELYRNTPDKWKRFNLNSDTNKRDLFYGKLRFPVTETTESGLPSTGADAIKHNNHPAMESYLKYEHANTITSNFSGPYIESSVADSKLHPGFNICGTVSYRLSGFKPYLLNAPFDEKAMLRHLRVEKGCVGVHADLSAIEPTITAHYSEDTSLLKVFGDGLGDIYLDLASELFPNDEELQSGYDKFAPITGAIKAKFSRQRKVAKVIQLAVQYGGTGHTVARNLTKDGIPTTPHEAEAYVRAYWRKFQAVADFETRLREINRRDGYLRNVSGRIIRVPDPNYKDLGNRFIQSSAHDVLIMWVLEIYTMCKHAGVKIKPVILDCHDSTSNMCPEEDVECLKQIYIEALNNVNDKLGLCVRVKAETKTFKTLAGLKGEEK